MSVPPAELAIDEARAARWIGAAFEPLRGCAVEPIGSGFDNAAFLVNQRWAFRLPRRAAAVPFMRREIEVLPALAEGAPVALSVPVWVSDGVAGYPFPFAGYAWIDGTPASRRTAHRASPDQLARLLRWLHDRELDHPGDVVVQGLGKQDPDVALATLRERLPRLDRDPAPVLEAAERLARAPIDPTRRWVHGDLYPRHLLLEDDGGLSGVIDWGDLHRGEIALDLSLAMGWLDPADRERFFAIYGPVTDAVAERARFLALYYGVILSDLGAQPGLEDLGPVGATYLRNVLDGG